MPTSCRATAISTIRTIDRDGTERLYDLNGRRIGGNAKGLVIKNGHKMLNHQRRRHLPPLHRLPDHGADHQIRCRGDNL